MFTGRIAEILEHKPTQLVTESSEVTVTDVDFDAFKMSGKVYDVTVSKGKDPKEITLAGELDDIKDTLLDLGYSNKDIKQLVTESDCSDEDELDEVQEKFIRKVNSKGKIKVKKSCPKNQRWVSTGPRTGACKALSEKQKKAKIGMGRKLKLAAKRKTTTTKKHARKKAKKALKKRKNLGW